VEFGQLLNPIFLKNETETDEEIPALQSPSDSSESEDEPIPPPQPRPAPRQRTVPLRRPSANVFDSDGSDFDITESDVQFARGLLRQYQEYTNTPPSVPAPPLEGPVGGDSSDLLDVLFLSSSSEDEDDRDTRRSRGRIRRANTMSPEQTRHQILQRFVSFISNRMRDHDSDREPDHLRAHAVIDGLESVSKDLLSRYEVVRGEDQRASCAVCYDPLHLDRFHDVEDLPGPVQTENKKLSLALPYHAALPAVVAFPCLHIFHSDCLLPWLSRKTTCPTCRFDVDPDSLTLKGGCTQRPWVPPADGVLEAWIQAEETKKLSHVKNDHYFSDPNMLNSGYETDASASSVESFRTCYDGESRVLES